MILLPCSQKTAYTVFQRNAELLLPGIYESINMAIENSFANKAAVAEVEKILKTLKDENVL